MIQHAVNANAYLTLAHFTLITIALDLIYGCVLRCTIIYARILIYSSDATDSHSSLTHLYRLLLRSRI